MVEASYQFPAPTPAQTLLVKYQPLDALVPFPRNARTHSKVQVRQIAESIRVFGFTNPVLVDPSNTIVAGHGRVAAAKLLNISEVLLTLTWGCRPTPPETSVR